MRISAISIFNYKGIARAEIDSLGAESVVTITGRNGTGKSLVLEAVVSLWTDRLFRSSANVGPWADSVEVGVTVELATDEWARVDSWHERFEGGGPAPRGSTELRTRFDRSGGTAYVSRPKVLDIVRNPGFQADHPFGIIDFLPATRIVPIAQSQAVDLPMLGADRIEQERSQALDNVLNNRGTMALPNIGNYLATLDYQNYLADRQGVVVEDEYQRMADAFQAATGKELMKPVLDRLLGSRIEIGLPTGHSHGLEALSTGEQEMLAMTYFVRRLSASGGILCLDEPEQHLHPTLQAALFSSMHDLSERAQILVVSHSVNLIAAAPQSGLLQLSPAIDATTNQLARVVNDPSRVELIGLLGITPADMFQSDGLLIVEGATDARWLPVLFPLELGRMRIIEAGSAGQVTQTNKVLEAVPSTLPWLCIRDRDLLSDDEVATIAGSSTMFVWSRRAIESILLDGTLISATITNVGVSIDASTIEGWLREIADKLQEDVVAALVEKEMTRRFPAPAARTELGRFKRMEQQLRDYADVNVQRADAVEAIAAEQREELQKRWEADWKKVVDPKPVLAELLKRVGTFKTVNDLTIALFTRAREDPSVRPQGFIDLETAIKQVLP